MREKVISIVSNPNSIVIPMDYWEARDEKQQRDWIRQIHKVEHHRKVGLTFMDQARRLFRIPPVRPLEIIHVDFKPQEEPSTA